VSRELFDASFSEEANLSDGRIMFNRDDENDPVIEVQQVSLVFFANLER
jgi:hypothetical protein